jgi:hypothetical protein
MAHLIDDPPNRVWNLILVTTGGGFELDEIGDLLATAVADESLPANPEGVARLEAAITTVARPPAPQPVAALPEMAHVISGQTFVFEPNPAGLETACLEFDDSAEATLHATFTGSEQMVSWPIALDGVYRLVPGEYGLLLGLRGAWADAQTFVFEYDNIANNDHATYRLRFEGDRVVMTGQETAHDLSEQFEGWLQEP